MNSFKHIIYTVLTVAFLFVLFRCGGDQTIKVKEEKIQYKNRIDSTLEKINRKLASMEAQYSPEDSLAERLDTAAGDELHNPAMDVEPMETTRMDLENLSDELNRKRAQIDLTPDEEWQQLKTEIDQLIARYDHVTGGRDSLGVR